jgi:hypothetical protein
MNIEIHETVEALNGTKITRLKSSLFYWAALISFVSGIYLIIQKVMFGGVLIIILAPCFLLYPLIRFLFGGKDSAAAVVATVVVEEVLKSEIKSLGSGKKRKRNY